MSVDFDATVDMLRRTSSYPNYNAAHTVCLWVKPHVANPYFIATLWGDNNNYDSLTVSGGKFQVEVYDDTMQESALGTTSYEVGTWYFVAMRRLSATQVDLYVNTAVEATSAAYDVTTRLASAGICVSGSNWYADFDGCIAQVRIWTTNLTDGELALEKASTTAVKTDGTLWAEYKLKTATADEEGWYDNIGTRDLTSYGTPTTGADDPPNGGPGAGLMWLA